MKVKNEIENKIEKYKIKLNKLLNMTNNHLIDPEILKISQDIDKLIVEYYKEQYKKDRQAHEEVYVVNNRRIKGENYE